MNIEKLLKYINKPSLYESGTSVMWTDPHISRQLLKHHIDKSSDLASRSDSKIDLIINWILSESKKSSMNILDLGCGPGLYAEKLAGLGHSVTGIDFSETSVDYARKTAEKTGSGIEYHCENYLNIDYENRFDLVILIYMDFCVLKPDEREKVLKNISRALKEDGIFIFDTVNSRNIDKKVLQPSWEVSLKGFWRNEPYIVFNNGYHYPENKVLANHHIVINQQEEIESYIFWSTYYDLEDLKPILNQCGFRKVSCHENVLPPGDIWNGDNVSFYIAEK